MNIYLGEAKKFYEVKILWFLNFDKRYETNFEICKYFFTSFKICHTFFEKLSKKYKTNKDKFLKDLFLFRNGISTIFFANKSYGISENHLFSSKTPKQDCS